MAIKPNEEQIVAIEKRNTDLLVSASAGAGKTACLCQRIVLGLTDERAPMDLARLLVVTFTRAAAAEMRERIGMMINERLEAIAKGEEPDSDGRKQFLLRAQLVKLPLARIGTIDSFCLDLIKGNFQRLEISASVRIADDAELDRTKERLMRRVMGRVRGENEQVYDQLTDGLLNAYPDDKLPATLIGFYEKTLSYPEGIRCLKEAELLARSDSVLLYEESESGRASLERTVNELSFFILGYEWYGAQVASEAKSVNLKAQLEEEKDLFYDVRDLIKEDPDAALRLAESYEFRNLASGEKCLQREYFMRLRGVAKKFIKDRKKLRLDFDLLSHDEQMKRTAEILSCYHRLLSLYEKELSLHKKKMGVIEFSDILLLAEKLLYNGDGSISDYARELSLEFDEIYIDEFQDVNDLQERIFTALARGNRFLVGDVKQSIYGFRGACPHIFSGKRDSYPMHDQNEAQGKLFLTKNYRSNSGVLHFVNATCGPLLSLCTDMTYYEEDDLQAGNEQLLPVLPQLCLVSNSKTYLPEAENKEATYTASCIAEMIRRGEKPSDIMILVRSRSKALADLLTALEMEGVEVETERGAAFFKTPEILLMKALLAAIDNPTSDISLVAALKSPAFGFTLDELLEIRRAGGGSFYNALTAYRQKTGDEKARTALDFLAEYRDLAGEQTADKLIWSLLDRLALAPLLGVEEGSERAEEISSNLLAFYGIARAACRSGAAELSAFLERIVRMEEKKGSSTEPPQKVEGKVRLMTFHGSKGLQAPVCWLYGCGNALSLKGRSVPFDRTYGPGFLLFDRDNGVLSSKSAFYHGVMSNTVEKGLNEELRLLYVAMTRAERSLYISGKASKDLMALADIGKCIYPLKREHLLYLNTPCYLSFLLMALHGREDACRILRDTFPTFEEREGGKGEQKKNAPPKEQNEDRADVEAQKDVFKKRLSFVYPHAAAVDLPAKLAASALQKDALDDRGRKLLLRELSEADPVPAFLSPERMRPSAAAIGTATHAFMQFCDFEQVEKEGVDAQLERLKALGFLDEKSALLVEKKEISAFFRSALYERLKRAKRVFREQRFMYETPAHTLIDDPQKKAAYGGETVIVQGVIDCFFEDEQGRVVLFDYKTDRFGRQALENEEDCMELLRLRHGNQLLGYRSAVEGLLGKKVDEVLLYSFALGREVSVL